jgi:hypothetical protein
MANCFKAQALADWVYWTQTSASANSSASRSWAVVPAHTTYGEGMLANFLASVRSERSPLRSS